MRDFVARHVASIPPSGIRKFFDIAATMENVISLGIGEPDFVTPDSILQAGVASLQKGQTGYSANSGILELREALGEHLNRLYGISYNPDSELLVTVGASEAVYLALNAILDPGDEVIIPQPSFVSYVPEVVLAGGVPVIVETRVEENFQVTGEAVEAAVTGKTKAILICYPNNPTGAVVSRERLMEIAQIAEKHDLVVISDEIYDQLIYGVTHNCFAALPNMRERTIFISGFSKSYAMTGWRIGYAAGPSEILGALRKIHQYTIMSAPTTAQMAALEAIQNGAEHVERMRDEYNRRRELIVGGLNELGMPTFEPKGAFYAFPSISATGMDDRLVLSTSDIKQPDPTQRGASLPSGQQYCVDDAIHHRVRDLAICDK